MRKRQETSPITPEDQAFFLQFYETYKDVIWRMTGKFVSAREDREDLAQEAVIRLMTHVDTLRELSHCKIVSYISLTVQSQFIDQLRAGHMELVCGLEDDMLDAFWYKEVAQHGGTPDSTTQWEVMHLLNQLPARDRLLLEGWYIIGSSQQEMARQLGCSPNSVRMALTRAREKARKILMKQQEGCEI